MLKIGNYYHISKDNVDIVPEKGTQVVSYFVSCFDRELVLLLNDRELTEDDTLEIYKQLGNAYIEWQDDDHFECCEEFMISKLDTYYRNSIVVVLYIGDNEDDDN